MEIAHLLDVCTSSAASAGQLHKHDAHKYQCYKSVRISSFDEDFCKSGSLCDDRISISGIYVDLSKKKKKNHEDL